MKMSKSIKKLGYEINVAGGMKTAEHGFYLFPEFEKNEVLSDQNKELPFKIYTCDTQDNNAHVNLYTISAYHNVMKLKNSSLYKVGMGRKMQNQILLCKSCPVDNKLQYMMIGTALHYHSCVEIYPFIIHQDSKKFRGLSSFSRPSTSSLSNRKPAIAPCGTNIYVYSPQLAR